jgi:hypothetical protein
VLPRVIGVQESPTMQTRTLLAAIATAAIAAIATPSLSNAQDTTVKKAISKGEVAMPPSYGSLISAINASAARNDKLKGMTMVNPTDVQFVNVEDLLKGNDVKALENALQKNDKDITTLRTTLGGNQTITTVIADTTANPTKIASNDIVAVDVNPDGKVILYYWKKP